MRQSIGQKAKALGHKVKVAASTSKERIGKLMPGHSANLDDDGPTRRLARLDTKFFATPDRAIAADKTWVPRCMCLRTRECCQCCARSARV
jgi:hypothetical protein